MLFIKIKTKTWSCVLLMWGGGQWTQLKWTEWLTSCLSLECNILAICFHQNLPKTRTPVSNRSNCLFWCSTDMVHFRASCLKHVVDQYAQRVWWICTKRPPWRPSNCRSSGVAGTVICILGILQSAFYSLARQPLHLLATQSCQSPLSSQSIWKRKKEKKQNEKSFNYKPVGSGVTSLKPYI